MKRRQFAVTAVAALFGTCLALPAAFSTFAADIDYGKPGTPVKLVVGYQPYYTQSWSGVVMRGKKVYEKYQPKEYLNQNIEVITSNFRAGKLDAAVMWQPTTSRLVDEGLARLIATGKSVQENDGGFLAMRADLIKQRPDVVKAWLQGELDAQ